MCVLLFVDTSLDDLLESAWFNMEKRQPRWWAFGNKDMKMPC